MPLKSKAQMGMLFHLQEEGKLPQGKAEEFVRETPSIKALPEHVRQPKRRPRKPTSPLGRPSDGFKKTCRRYYARGFLDAD